MADDGPDVDLVRGEMQPWSDYGGRRPPVGGAVLAAFLDDVLPDRARALVVGPHDVDVIETVAARSADVVVLVRSVADAIGLRAQLGGQVTVVAGALDGLVAGDRPRFDSVIAADGLDRVLGYDSDALDWPQRLALLAAITTPAAVVVLGLENEFSLTALLDRRPRDQRHGDDEWRPLYDDPRRPVSAGQFADELRRAGLANARTYAAFSPGGTPLALVSADQAAAARPGQLPARLAVEALETAAAAVPLLAPIGAGARSAARAGLLGAVPTGWVAVVGGREGSGMYARVQGSPAVLTADVSADGWGIAVRTGPQQATDQTAMVRASPGSIPPVVPDSVSVETVLLRLAAAEDVPGFRALAARLGEWARARDDSQLLLRWDDVVVDGESFAFGISPWTAQSGAAADLLAAAWHRFQDELLSGHHRHPWPPWILGDDLVSVWLSMSGVPADSTRIAHGRKLADALATATGVPPGSSRLPDLRTALADAERAREECRELAGHIFGLERTLSLRDKALRTRDARLREVRGRLQEVTAAQARLRGSRAYRLVRLVREPRKVAGKVKRRLPDQLRRLTG